MSSKSDKPLAIKTSAISAAAIILFHIAFSFGMKGFISTFIDGIAIGLFLYQSYRAYTVADDPAFDNSSRAWTIIYAVIICIYVGSLAAYQNELVK